MGEPHHGRYGGLGCDHSSDEYLLTSQSCLLPANTSCQMHAAIYTLEDLVLLPRQTRVAVRAALATEMPTPELLLEKPHGRNEPLISRRMWKHVVVQGLYQLFWLFLVIYGAPAQLPAFAVRCAGHAGATCTAGHRQSQQVCCPVFVVRRTCKASQKNSLQRSTAPP